MPDKKKNKVNEPLETYGLPLTFEKVWLMFQETDKQFKKTDEKLDRIGKLVGNIANNNADVAESFF